MKWQSLPLLLPVLYAAGLALSGSPQRGPLWPDSPRYANAAAMIHDWYRAPGWPNPVGFAEANYARYPAFNIPFHPPGFPALLAGWFWAWGVGETAARLFVAACWAGCVALFLCLQATLGVRGWRGALSGLVLASTPILVHWSRDTMSEIPALLFLLAATLSYQQYLMRQGRWRLLLAFALWAAAFQCRVTAVALLPGWALLAAFEGRGRALLRSPLAWGLGSVAVLGVLLWVRWVSGYARYEVEADGRAEGPSLAAARYFLEAGGDLLRDGNGGLLLISLVLVAARRVWDAPTRFWLAWLGACVAFKLLMPTTPEPRHLLLALPACAGLASVWLPRERLGYREHGVALLLLAVVFNGGRVARLPAGLTGYAPVAELLAGQREQGNCFLACPHDQDLIFRYRSRPGAPERVMVRSDRTLSTRVADYARRDPQIHLRQTREVLEVFRKGRVRFVVLTADAPEMPHDWELTRRTVEEHPGQFEPLGEFDLRIQFDRPGYGSRVAVYRNLQELPEGPSELPVTIPTAGLQLPAGAEKP